MCTLLEQACIRMSGSCEILLQSGIKIQFKIANTSHFHPEGTAEEVCELRMIKSATSVIQTSTPKGLLFVISMTCM